MTVAQTEDQTPSVRSVQPVGTQSDDLAERSRHSSEPAAQQRSGEGSNLNENAAATGWSSSTLDEFDADVRAVLCEGGTAMELPLPRGALGSRGRDINDSGKVVLSAYFEPGGLWSGANNVGEVVGTTSHRDCWDPPDVTLRATLWRDRAVYDLE